MEDVLVGGALVLAGGLITELAHFLRTNNDRKERKHQLLRQKYEELCESIADTTEELRQLGESQKIEDVISSRPPTSAQKMCYLAMIYFPELVDVTIGYNASMLEYFQFLLHRFDPTVPASPRAQAFQHPDFQKLTSDVMAAKSRLDTAIQDNAKTYTKA